MQIIPEDNISFSFPDNWYVFKYDEHSFYRENLEPVKAELKALDFVARYRQDNLDYLVLIEVKDFRNHDPENRKRKTNGDLVQEVLEKALHSIAGLYVGAYHLQQEHLRLLNFTNGFPDKIKLVLFMEDDPLLGKSRILKENQAKTRDNIYLRLTSRLKKRLSIIPELLCIEDIRPRHLFTVTSI